MCIERDLGVNMYKVIVSKDRINAVIHFTNGRTMRLYDSNGQVLNLVIYMISPMESQVETLEQYETSLGDTAIVSLKDVLKR